MDKVGDTVGPTGDLVKWVGTMGWTVKTDGSGKIISYEGDFEMQMSNGVANPNGLNGPVAPNLLRRMTNTNRFVDCLMTWRFEDEGQYHVTLRGGSALSYWYVLIRQGERAFQLRFPLILHQGG